MPSYACESWQWRSQVLRVAAGPYFVFVPLAPLAPRMSIEETVEFISRPFFPLAAILPRSEAQPGPGRPPARSKQQRLIDLSVRVRRGVYHKLVRLPANRKKANASKRDHPNVSVRECIYRLADAHAARVPKGNLAGRIFREMQDDPRLPKAKLSTVRAYLTNWRRNFKK